MPDDVHVALYRIAQEALNNVVKHARTSQAAVSLYCSSNADEEEPHSSVELRVSDDGVGFDPSGVEPGELGLGIMRERAQAVGAELIIESQLGQGTTINLAWKG